jgi:chemotaxis protein CheY-P-specific phosphatase CheC
MYHDIKPVLNSIPQIAESVITDYCQEIKIITRKNVSYPINQPIISFLVQFFGEFNGVIILSIGENSLVRLANSISAEKFDIKINEVQGLATSIFSEISNNIAGRVAAQISALLKKKCNLLSPLLIYYATDIVPDSESASAYGITLTTTHGDISFRIIC